MTIRAIGKFKVEKSGVGKFTKKDRAAWVFSWKMKSLVGKIVEKFSWKDPGIGIFGWKDRGVRKMVEFESFELESLKLESLKLESPKTESFCSSWK